MSKHVVKFLEQSWLLIVCAFIFGVLLAVTDAALAPRIEANRIAKIERLGMQVMPESRNMQPAGEVAVRIGDELLDVPVYRAVDGERTVGWAFVITGSGYADRIEMLVGVDPSGERLLGFGVVFSNETPGFGDRITEPFFNDQFKGAPVGQLELVRVGDPKQIDSNIVAISGATVSSRAVVNAMNLYIESVVDEMRKAGLIENGGR